MPVTQTTELTIECDNPDCAGMSELDASDRVGWTFVTAEVYGQPPTQHVYCCPGCAGALAATLEDAASKPAPEPPPIVEPR